MRLARRALLRLRAIFGRRQLEAAMNAEMREHLDRATDRLIARGMSPDDARIAVTARARLLFIFRPAGPMWANR